LPQNIREDMLEVTLIVLSQLIFCPCYIWCKFLWRSMFCNLKYSNMNLVVTLNALDFMSSSWFKEKKVGTLLWIRSILIVWSMRWRSCLWITSVLLSLKQIGLIIWVYGNLSLSSKWKPFSLTTHIATWGICCCDGVSKPA